MIVKIFVRVKPGSKLPKVEKIDDTHFVVSVRSPAREGKANKETTKLVAEYFKTSLARVSIIKGHSGRSKIMEIIV